jgi:heat shock protein HtpX
MTTGHTHASRFSNYARTAALLGLLTALTLWAGAALGGASGLVYAGLFVAAMNFGSYWFSDKLVLALNGARPVSRQELPEVHALVEELAEKAGIPVPKVYVMESATPNAFATGRSPAHAAVAVTTGILQILDRRELRGVLGHELSHVLNRDTLISTVAGTLAGVVSQLGRVLFWLGSGPTDGDGRRRSGGEELLVALLAPVGAMLLQLAISRSREFGADEDGARLSGDPEALARALAKLERGVTRWPDDRVPSTAHLMIVNPLPKGFFRSLFSTHPTTEARIARLMALSRG